MQGRRHAAECIAVHVLLQAGVFEAPSLALVGRAGVNEGEDAVGATGVGEGRERGRG
jgi:hypothetical protein